MRITGSVIVVTGAGSGIGQATAVAAAARGGHVVAVDRHPDRLDALRRRTGALSVCTDVTGDGHAREVVDAALDRYGRLDAVIANAGIGYDGAFADMPVERIDELIAVNLRAPMLLVHAALPHLVGRARPAAIAFTSSIAGAVPVPNEAAYCASKTALESFADALRAELRGGNVSVSVVRPGVVRTAFHDNRNEPYERPFPRLLAPERVADVILDAVERGTEERTVPAWLGVAVQTRRHTPWLYRRLARRFG